MLGCGIVSVYDDNYMVIQFGRCPGSSCISDSVAVASARVPYSSGHVADWLRIGRIGGMETQYVQRACFCIERVPPL